MNTTTTSSPIANTYISSESQVEKFSEVSKLGVQDLSAEIHIKPSSKTHWAIPVRVRVIELLLLVFSIYFFSENHMFFYLVFLSLLFLLWKDLYRWLYLRSCEWIITNEEIYQKSGVFSTVVDHIEMYRVTDYKEEQNLMMRLLKIKKVALISNDRLTKVVWIQGVPASTPLISTIRARVEACRANKRVSEFFHN